MACARLEVRVNGNVIRAYGTQDCRDEGTTACDTFEWNEATYVAPPSEMLAAVIHKHLDRMTAGPGSQAVQLSTDGGSSRSGNRSVSMSRTLPSMSAMMSRTVSSSWPPGSATGQSTYFTPGT